MSTAPLLTVRPMESSDEPEVLDLLAAAMAVPTEPEFFGWKHHANPFGTSPGLVAVDGERVVGVRLFLRWKLVGDGEVLNAVRAVDTATHPDYQRQGIFRRLTLDLLDHLERTERLDLVFNTPNADSRPGYLKLGWQEVGRLPVHISPVRPLAFVRGARRASTANASSSATTLAAVSTAERAPRDCPLPRAAEVLEDASSLGDLLDQLATTARLHTPLSVDYLRWRYGAVPGMDYRCVPVTRGNELVGVGFGRVRRRADLAEFTLGDVIVRAGDRQTARKVLRGARRSGADHVAMHAAPDSEVSEQTARSGYLRAPGRGICLVANPRRTNSVDVLAASSWRLSLGDLEVF